MTVAEWKTLSRFVAAIVSGAILGVLIWQLDTAKLVQTLRVMSPGWFAAAVVANGLLFVPAAMRWHLMLKVVNCAVNFLTTLRCVLVGHFFYVGLFGAVGGDSMRSICYARWYNRPLAPVLSTAPLDRLLGFVGLLLFAGFGAALAKLPGELNLFSAGFLRKPSSWIIVAAIVIVLWLLARNVKTSQFARDFTASLKKGFAAFLASPRLSVVGVLCGVGVQLALSGVLALCLRSVWSGSLPWLHLIWTFPLISLLGGLPITVAGLGTREAAALSLFGLYGINAETAVAASLLSLLCAVFWAVCGAVLYWLHPRNAEPATCIGPGQLAGEHVRKPNHPAK